MPESYPYTISNNKIEPILSRVRSAAKPERFSRDLLTTWGFTASNDRAMVSVMKELGFLTEAGVPNEKYDRLRDPNDWRYVLAEGVRNCYSELFAIDGNMQAAPETEIRGAMSRVTGKDEETVKRYYATFKALASLAKFEPKPGRSANAPELEEQIPVVKPEKPEKVSEEHGHRRKSEYHYNIQIHLPVTTDITVYNAIFKSLKEHLDP